MVMMGLVLHPGVPHLICRTLIEGECFPRIDMLVVQMIYLASELIAEREDAFGSLPKGVR